MSTNYFVRTLLSSFNDILHTLRASIKNDRLHADWRSTIRSTTFAGSCRVMKYAEIRDCRIGHMTYFAPYSRFNDVSVGAFCSIGPNVQAGLGLHPSRNYLSTSPCFFSTGLQAGETYVDRNSFTERMPISIGNDVWIGANCIISDGISIGDGAIIASGSVVTKDVPAFMIVGGIPAKVIRSRFEAETVELIKKGRWWDRSDQRLSEEVKNFSYESEKNLRSFLADLEKK